MSALLTSTAPTDTEMLPTEPLSFFTPALYGIKPTPSLPGSEFQLSTEALLPLNEIESFATSPLANFDVLRSCTLIHLSMVRVLAPPTVTVARVTIVGAAPPV